MANLWIINPHFAILFMKVTKSSSLLLAAVVTPPCYWDGGNKSCESPYHSFDEP